MKKEKSCTVYWFRNALRLHDNPSLLTACQNSTSLLPIYIIDPEEPFAQTPHRKAGIIRAKFILESLRDLESKLCSKGSRLCVVKGKPEEVLPEVICRVQADALMYERECAAPMRERDNVTFRAIRERCKQGGDLQKVDIEGLDTHTLFPMEKYVSKCPGGVAPASYGGFRKIFDKLGPVPAEVDPVESIPPLPARFSSLDESFSFHEDFSVPTLEQIGYTGELPDNKGIAFPGGEEEGLKLLKKCMSRKAWIAKFEKPKTLPNSLDVDTTGLSPYVKHGCISARRFYHQLSAIYTQHPKHSLPPVSLHGQLLWREYNYLTGYTTPNFSSMRGNPVARQIPWDDDPALLRKWRDGETGYPFIDAIMTQLRETGWIHHLARHAVACFLTRGDLWQSWERGAEVFEEELIDADWSINNFNWQWLSCTAHFYQYFRCYSPVAFGKKTDKNGDYIRKWLPQFKHFPAKYIYEPWNAPNAIQKSTGVIIGDTYPEPIVDHKSVSKANMGRMKEAYAAANGEVQGEEAVVEVPVGSNGRNASRRGEGSGNASKRRRT